MPHYETLYKPDIHVIAIDETEHYSFDEGDGEHISKVRSVYLYDSNNITNYL